MAASPIHSAAGCGIARMSSSHSKLHAAWVWLSAACSVMTVRWLFSNVKPVVLQHAAPRPGNTPFKWEYDDAVPETWQVWLQVCAAGSAICRVMHILMLQQRYLDPYLHLWSLR
jgi:hypothetical protein